MAAIERRWCRPKGGVIVYCNVVVGRDTGDRRRGDGDWAKHLMPSLMCVV